MNAESIILFDGECTLCSGAVQFIARRDPEGRFHFASLQSPAGKQLAKQRGLSEGDLSSMILIEGNEAFTRSTAVLRVARHLRGPAKLAAAGLVLPRRLRDSVYTFVARRRHAWFGRESCAVSDAALRQRILG